MDEPEKPQRSGRQAGLFAVQLGAALSDRRRAQGLTLQELSLVSGVGIATLSKLENGVADARLSTVDRVFSALGVDGGAVARALVEGRDPPEQGRDGSGTGLAAAGYDPEELG